MALSFGGRRRNVIPPSNLGQEHVAQRRVAEAAGRAAEKTSIAISVDAFPTRVWLRQPRGSVQCPCSAEQYYGPEHTPLAPTETARAHVNPGEGDDLNSVDSGFPRDGAIPAPGEELNAPAPQGYTSWIHEIGRLILGEGRRCGLCWGTGWIDGFRLWGGQRYLCCAIPETPWATIIFESGVDVDLESPTPTMVGPATITWALDTVPGINLLDVVRVRDGVRPATCGWTLQATSASFPNPTDIAIVLGTTFGTITGMELHSGQIPQTITLTIPEGGRVSHVELIMRSEPLVNLQLPQLAMALNTELVQPNLVEDFELDPIVGWLERGSVLEVLGFGGRLGSLWQVGDVTVNRIAQGVTWGIVGSARNIQPNEILAVASMEDALGTGMLDPGLAPRGFESTGAGVPGGLPDGQSDESIAAVKSGVSGRSGGGSAPADAPVIVLTPLPED
jgi:hypothetical protein